MFGLKIHMVTIDGETADNIPWSDKFAFQTPWDDLIVGDFAIGTADEKMMLAPEWLWDNPMRTRYNPAGIASCKVVR